MLIWREYNSNLPIWATTYLETTLDCDRENTRGKMEKRRYRDLLEGAVMIGEIFISPSER